METPPCLFCMEASPENPKWGTKAGLDLRVLRGGKNEVGNVADGCLEVVAGRTGELLPLRVAAEAIPACVQLGHIREGQHVGEAGHVRADQGVAIEDLTAAGPLKDL